MTAFLHTIPEWVILISLTLCLGILVCRLWVLEPSADEGHSYQGDILARLWRLLGVSVAVIIIGSVADLMIRAMEISGRPVSAVFPVLPTVILKTHLGRVWLVRMASLIFLAITLKTGRRYRDSRRFLGLALGFTVLVAMTESASGHASDKGDFSIAEIIDFLHLLGASVWGGGLLALSIAILPALAAQGEQAAPFNASMARRFSSIAGLSVGIIALTSCYNVWAYVGSFGAFSKTSYGWAAAAKIILFSFVLYLGAFNRYVSVPLLQECACDSSGGISFMERSAVRFFPRYLCTTEKSLIFSRFTLSVKIEALLLILILLCAAFLRHDIPARHHSHMEHAPGKVQPLSPPDGVQHMPDSHEHNH